MGGTYEATRTASYHRGHVSPNEYPDGRLHHRSNSWHVLPIPYRHGGDILSLDIASLFQRGNRDDYSQIIKSLLNPENVELKTELPNPQAVTALTIIGKWCENEGCTRTADLIEGYLTRYRIDMVSNRRKSREEVVNAISDLRKQRLDMRSRMFGGQP